LRHLFLGLEFENVAAALGQALAPRKRGSGERPCGEGARYSEISRARKKRD